MRGRLPRGVCSLAVLFLYLLKDFRYIHSVGAQSCKGPWQHLDHLLADRCVVDKEQQPHRRAQNREGEERRVSLVSVKEDGKEHQRVSGRERKGWARGRGDPPHTHTKTLLAPLLRSTQQAVCDPLCSWKDCVRVDIV